MAVGAFGPQDWEDERIRTLVSLHGPGKWSAIAEKLPGRMGKQCRERWYNHLDPNIKKGPWTEEEERIVLQAHAEMGTAWAQIAKLLDGRTDNSIKNWWYSSLRHRDSGASVQARRQPTKSEAAPARRQPTKSEAALSVASGAVAHHSLCRWDPGAGLQASVHLAGY